MNDSQQKYIHFYSFFSILFLFYFFVNLYRVVDDFILFYFILFYLFLLRFFLSLWKGDLMYLFMCLFVVVFVFFIN